MRIGPDQIALSTETQVLDSETLQSQWSSTSGSTLLFYVNPLIVDRTSVSGNEYANLVKIGSKQTLKLLVSSDAGRGYGSSPAILEIYVKGCTIPEIVEIPKISIQKWSSVGIVKQGRKFTIYVNGVLTVSYTCTAMPDFDATQTLRVGDKRLGGVIGMMSLAPYAMSPADMKSMVENTVDIDGKPYFSSRLFAFIPVPTFNIKFNLWCPGGDCSSSVTKGPLDEWSTNYS